MGSLHGFNFKKGLKEMFSQICRSAGRVPRVRKRKSRLGPFRNYQDYKGYSNHMELLSLLEEGSLHDGFRELAECSMSL